MAGTQAEQSGGFFDQAKQFFGGIFGSGKPDPAEAGARKIGDITVPGRTGDGLSMADKWKMKIRRFSSGDVDMIDDIHMRYPKLDLTGSLKGLAANESLKTDVMKALHGNEQLPYYAADALNGNEGLQAQFEDLIRNDPEKMRSLLPELEKHPEKFKELISQNGRPVDVAMDAVNKAKAEEGFDFWKVLSGESTFSKELAGVLPANLMNGLMSLPFMQQLMGMLDGLFKSDGLIGQNLQPGGPMAGFMNMFGVDASKVHNVGAPENTAGAKPAAPAANSQQQPVNQDMPTAKNLSGGVTPPSPAGQ